MNKSEELDCLYGIIYGSCSWFLGSWWVLLISPLCGLLWMWGGDGFAGWNGWRRIIMPGVMCGLFFLRYHSGWPLVSFFLQWGALSIGYGVPDVNDPKGSWLGRIFGKWTRVVWFIILGAAMVPMFL